MTVSPRALPARHRPALLGLVYLLVLGLLVSLCVLAYRRELPWQRAVAVHLVTSQAGLELNPGSDVKLQGRLVGRVDSIESDGRHAVVDLALDPDETHLVPADVDAAIVPKTLFGEKYVDLIPPLRASSEPIADGDLIRQTRSAVEIGDVYAKLVPLLRAVDPAQLSLVLTSLADALEGRGRQAGRIIDNVDAFLADLDPALGVLEQDLRYLAVTLDGYADTSPELLRVLADAATMSRELVVPSEQRLRNLLDEVVTTSEVAGSVVDQNAEDIITITGTSRRVLSVLDTYAEVIPCSLRGLHLLDKLGNQVTGARGPFTLLNVDLFIQGDPYVYPRDLPSGSGDANNRNLPPLVPDWDPHCPRFGKLTEQVKDADPFSLQPLPGQVLTPSSDPPTASGSGTAAQTGPAGHTDPRLAEALGARFLAETDVHASARERQRRRVLAGLMLGPLMYDGEVRLP